MAKKISFLACMAIAISGSLVPALGLEDSVGEAGIEALRLQTFPYNLTGRKISIGQVEIGRPSKFGLDKAASEQTVFELKGAFYRNKSALSNRFVDDHAAQVATVMISKDKKLTGVAPQARLYASAIGPLDRAGQPEQCLATQHVAEQNGKDVRAINFSFGESLKRDPRPNPQLDGLALLTLCIDWSARVHDVLYVVAGNQGKGGIAIPTDHFNGIITASSAKRQGKFTKIDFSNLSSEPKGIGRRLIKREINTNNRRGINLVAPGNNIEIYDLKGKSISASGTSFAAPHVTGSVALLQEFGDAILAGDRRTKLGLNWSMDSRRHEVMKAVLLNSADKIKDRGRGLQLGMTRTLLTKKNRNWLQSNAYWNDRIPVDLEMGAGHLNTYRAYQQFSGGRWSHKSLIPSRGWDYAGINLYSYRDYQIESPLQKDSYVAITLVWDRLVELEDRNQNQRYDVGENFRDRGLNDLNIYLMSADKTHTIESVCASRSKVDSIEHIFCKIPDTGRYKIRVDYPHKVNDPTQFYGLAWWTFPSEGLSSQN